MKKILVIDDDVLVLRAISKLLTMNNYNVTEAKSGEEAAGILSSADFDLIVSGIRMAGMDGIQLVERLRSSGKNTPVIFVTGYASENAPVEAYRLEVKDYVLKPFDKDDLLRKVEKNLALREAEFAKKGDLCRTVRGLVRDFEKNNSMNIYENENLKKFISELNAALFAEEKEQAKKYE